VEEIIARILLFILFYISIISMNFLMNINRNFANFQNKLSKEMGSFSDQSNLLTIQEMQQLFEKKIFDNETEYRETMLKKKKSWKLMYIMLISFAGIFTLYFLDAPLIDKSFGFTVIIFFMFFFMGKGGFDKDIQEEYGSYLDMLTEKSEKFFKSLKSMNIIDISPENSNELFCDRIKEVDESQIEMVKFLELIDINRNFYQDYIKILYLIPIPFLIHWLAGYLLQIPSLGFFLGFCGSLIVFGIWIHESRIFALFNSINLSNFIQYCDK
jgi:hypothetical protein